MKTRKEISNADDVIDIRDVIARFETLENELDECTFDDEQTCRDEVELLDRLLSDLKGYGGDEQWRGNWYPIALIRDSYFKNYAQELADDIGAIPDNAAWPCTCIDWEQATRELKMDYSAVEFDGVTYWYR